MDGSVPEAPGADFSLSPVIIHEDSQRHNAGIILQKEGAPRLWGVGRIHRQGSGAPEFAGGAQR